MQFMIEDLLTAGSTVTQPGGNSSRSSVRREIERLILGMDSASGAGDFQQIDHGNQPQLAASGRVVERDTTAAYGGGAQPRRIE